MKKSIFAAALICVMTLNPMSINANTVQNSQSNLEMQQDHHHHHQERCASPEQVDALIETLKHTPFDNDKKRVAMQAIRMRPMNAKGIRRVAECFTFDNDKKEFLKNAFPYCVNQADYYQVLNVLTFSSDKEDVMRYMDKYLDSHCSSGGYYEEYRY